MSERSRERPIRIDASYADWYPYTHVRTAINPDEPCQEDVMDAWWNTLQVAELSGVAQHILINAPTGLGKTPAVLAPALSWQQSAPQSRQVYYVVATVNQHDNPIGELQWLYDRRIGQELPTDLKVVDLVGEAQMVGESAFCLSPSSYPVPANCRSLRRSAVWADLPKRPVSWREVAEMFRGQDVCPYHFLIGLMASADIVICDYWWVFDPDVAKIWPQTNLFGNRAVALIVDEAHNLIPRVRGSRDVEVSQKRLLEKLRQCPDSDTREALMPLVSLLFGAGSLADDAASTGLSPSQVRQHLDQAILGKAQLYWMGQRNASSGERNLLPVEERILLNLLEPEDDNVVIYTTQDESLSPFRISVASTLHFRRVDATQNLKRAYERVKASVTLSATLVAPSDSAQELRKLVPQFGLPDRTQVLKADTPFDSIQQLWIYDSYPSGTYMQRDRYMQYYQNAISLIGKATEEGVTAVFFSSYKFLEDVHNGMPPEEQRLVIRETPADSKLEAEGARSLEGYERDLRRVMYDAGNTRNRAYLFSVYAGKLAQGANFGDNLIKTVVCVYIPTEMIELFHQRLCKRLWSLFYPGEPQPDAPLNDRDVRNKLAWKDAWQYAYERPAMYQVLQAAGRGIRALKDRCAFVLLDRRYHEFVWHDFLKPEPFHADAPHIRVRMFHKGAPERFEDVSGAWDPLLPTLKPL